MQISAWGRLSSDDHSTLALHNRHRLEGVVNTHTPGLAYGMGRSYGDVCLNPNGNLWMTRGLDHLIAFDEESGHLVCEAGVLLRDIQALFIPRGWMLPVTPGTQMITVGGAIANDVHGKSHHMTGSFGNHVVRMRLLRTDGEVIDCSPTEKADWFAATVGGIGLTGVITEATLQLVKIPGPWLETETIAYETVDEFFQLTDASKSWAHSVSWIDCVGNGGGRGLFMRGNPSDASAEKSYKASRKSMPFVPPVSLVNRLTLRPFNTFYYHLKKRYKTRGLTHYEPFFYPLDNLHHWNRMYGPKGFYQYQSVIPDAAGKEATQAMLTEIARSGEGSFLAVLKTFGGKPSVGMMSFPQSGVTLALDFPNKGRKTLALFERLDAIVREAQGRLYLAKDARMPKELFESGYPRLNEFIQYRDKGISSAMSRRLLGE